MLEEALNSPTHAPADTATGLLGYFKYELPSSPSEEYRFCQILYPLIVARIFGPLDVTNEELGRKYRHANGGWMALKNRWSMPLSFNRTSVNGRETGMPTSSSSSSIQRDPVVILLSISPPYDHVAQRNQRLPRLRVIQQAVSQLQAESSVTMDQPTLIDVISMESEHRPAIHLSFPFQALTPASQEVLLESVSSRIGFGTADHRGSDREGMARMDNCRKLFNTSISVHPMEQRSIVQYVQQLTYFQKEWELQQRRGYRSSTNAMQQQFSPLGRLASPTPQSARPVLDATMASPTKVMQKMESEARIMLTMWEYYFFMFIRYPFCKPLPQDPNNQRAKSQAHPSNQSPSYPLSQSSYRTVSDGTGGHYGEVVYSHLFNNYVLHYLLHSPSTSSGTFESSRVTLLPTPDAHPVSSESEVFLRIVINYWLDWTNVPVSNSDLVSENRRYHEGQLQPSQRKSWQGLSNAYDNAQLSPANGGRHYPSPSLVCKGLRFLINHICSDPAVEQNVLRWTHSENRIDSDNETLEPWCLTTPMTMLQQSILNYIRLAFRHAPFHTSDSTFFTAMDVWLTWIEPWNWKLKKSTFVSGALSPTAAKDRILHQMSGSTAYGGGPSMAALRPTSPSQYTSSWQPFIVANIHIYTTPLAIFIRRAKDMDFSPRTFRRFITAVQRVFRVFSPEVIDAINATLKSTDMTSRHRALRTHHENKLGEFCPPDPVSLTTLQSDMHNLLEEIYFQHEKKIREMDFFARFDDKIHNLSGQGSKSELTTIDQVKKNGLEIVGLSSDYVVSSLNKSKVTDKSTSTSNLIRVSSPERMKEGLLTERGKQQILSGERVCRPQNVFGLGDPMNARVRSYEIPFLVYWSIFASRWLNAWLGLTPHDALSHQTSRCGNDNVLKLLREGEESQRHWIRINLRFLADYRNLIFLALLGSTIFTGIQIYSKFVT